MRDIQIAGCYGRAQNGLTFFFCIQCIVVAAYGAMIQLVGLVPNTLESTNPQTPLNYYLRFWNAKPRFWMNRRSEKGTPHMSRCDQNHLLLLPTLPVPLRIAILWRIKPRQMLHLFHFRPVQPYTHSPLMNSSLQTHRSLRILNISQGRLLLTHAPVPFQVLS